MPIFEVALLELYGDRAQEAHFRNVAGAEDAQLVALLTGLRSELAQADASARSVRGMADAMAVHLARHYVDVGASNRGFVPVLPGFGPTPEALAVAPIAQQAKKPMIIMNAATSVITTKSDYIPRFSMTLPQISAPMAD
jgi:hypothetical protein